MDKPFVCTMYIHTNHRIAKNMHEWAHLHGDGELLGTLRYMCAYQQMRIPAVDKQLKHQHCPRKWRLNRWSPKFHWNTLQLGPWLAAHQWSCQGYYHTAYPRWYRTHSHHQWSESEHLHRCRELGKTTKMSDAYNMIICNKATIRSLWGLRSAQLHPTA